MPRTAWVFTDLTTLDTYEWEINPLEGNEGTFEKNVTYQSPAAADGSLIIFEGRDQPNTASWSGTILTEDQYTTLKTWYQKRHPIQLDDDLGRSFVIYITRFTPRRVRNRTYPWKHTYTIDYIITEEL